MRPCKGPDIWKNMAGHRPLATVEVQGLRWTLRQPTAVVSAAEMAAGLGEELGVAKMWMRETETWSWAAVPCLVAPEESCD